jgi:hypothetical protein
VEVQPVEVIGGGSNHSRQGHTASSKVGDLGEASGESVNGRFGLALFIVANRGDLSGQGLAPGLPVEETG